MPTIERIIDHCKYKQGAEIIDAIHLYEHVKNDIKYWQPKIRQGGMICGDDYCHAFPGVIKAVNKIFKDKVQVFRKNNIYYQWAGFL
jgi:hypothetical protein